MDHESRHPAGRNNNDPPGPSSTSARPGAPPDPGRLGAMITTHELCKSYGRTPVVHDVSFDCQPGTITGVLGPTGAGKSPTLRMVPGLTRPDSGAATVQGTRYGGLGNPARVVGTLLDA